MITLLKDWEGRVDINGQEYESIAQIPSNLEFKAGWCIKLLPKTKNSNIERNTTSNSDSTTADTTEYKITVKKYMTETANPGFTFMADKNNNIPMPLRTMTGVKLKETKGMVYMKLHGQAEATVTCMRCHRQLTNPVSKLYGIGPECINHVPLIMDLDINDVDAIKQKLVDVTWTGWVIKSAIIEEEVI